MAWGKYWGFLCVLAFSVLSCTRGTLTYYGAVSTSCPRVVESGYIVYSSLPLGSLADFVIQPDVGPSISCTGVTQCKFRLPNQSSDGVVWGLGSIHSVAVSVTVSGITVSRTFSYTKGLNRDLNGDGYPDMAVASRQTPAGAVYVYDGGPSGLSSTPSSTVVYVLGVAFGYSLAFAGDINGDGYGDLVVGDPDATTFRGRVQSFLGASTGVSGSPSFTKNGSTNNFQLGLSVAAVGDKNDDGLDDFIVGEPGYNPGGFIKQGRALIFAGDALNGFASAPIHTIVSVSGAASREFGRSVSGAGDLNADGRPDFCVGDPGVLSTMAGNAHCYANLTSSTISAPITLSFGENEDKFGEKVSIAGDIDGDGYADLVVGAPKRDAFASDSGAVYVYFSQSSAPPSPPAFAAPIELSDNTLNGSSLLGAALTRGDVNGDGYADIIASAQGADIGGDLSYGKLNVYFGNSTRFSLGATPLTFRGGSGQSNVVFGKALGATDANGDGFTDLMVGATQFFSSFGSDGKAFVFPGSATGPSGSNFLGLLEPSPGANYFFGSASD